MLCSSWKPLYDYRNQLGNVYFCFRFYFFDDAAFFVLFSSITEADYNEATATTVAVAVAGIIAVVFYLRI